LVTGNSSLQGSTVDSPAQREVQVGAPKAGRCSSA
jgi:hypothetical protein